MNKYLNISNIPKELVFDLLVSFMIYPTDDEKLSDFVAWISLYGESLHQPNVHLQRLLNINEIQLSKDFSSANPRGQLAGQVFITVLELYANRIQFPSIDKAIHCVSKRNQQRNNINRAIDGNTLRVGYEKVKDCWKEFRSTAYIWAAYVFACGEVISKGGSKDDLREYLKQDEWLKTLQGFYNFGITFKLPKSTKTLIESENTLHLIGLPEYNLPIQFCNADPELIKTLKSFKSRNRGQ